MVFGVVVGEAGTRPTALPSPAPGRAGSIAPSRRVALHAALGLAGAGGGVGGERRRQVGGHVVSDRSVHADGLRDVCLRLRVQRLVSLLAALGEQRALGWRQRRAKGRQS